MLFGHGYNDTTNAFKAYRREVIDNVQPLLSHHFNLTVELPLKAVVRGHSYAIVPIAWTQPRGRATSKLALRGDGQPLPVHRAATSSSSTTSAAATTGEWTLLWRGRAAGGRDVPLRASTKSRSKAAVARDHEHEARDGHGHEDDEPEQQRRADRLAAGDVIAPSANSTAAS